VLQKEKKGVRELREKEAFPSSGTRLRQNKKEGREGEGGIARGPPATQSAITLFIFCFVLDRSEEREEKRKRKKGRGKRSSREGGTHKKGNGPQWSHGLVLRCCRCRRPPRLIAKKVEEKKKKKKTNEEEEKDLYPRKVTRVHARTVRRITLFLSSTTSSPTTPLPSDNGWKGGEREGEKKRRRGKKRIGISWEESNADLSTLPIPLPGGMSELRCRGRRGKKKERKAREGGNGQSIFGGGRRRVKGKRGKKNQTSSRGGERKRWQHALNSFVSTVSCVRREEGGGGRKEGEGKGREEGTKVRDWEKRRRKVPG